MLRWLQSKGANPRRARRESQTGFAAWALERAPESRYLVEEASLKPYPCGIVIHPLTDACIALASPGGLGASDVRSVRALVHPRALELADRQHPANALEARHSLQHAAALALARGSASLSDFDGAQVDEPGLVAWRDVIDVAPGTEAQVGAARVILELGGGERREHREQHPGGSPERPLTGARLHGKFSELARRAMDERAAQRLYRDCLAVDRLPAANALRRHWQSGTTEGEGVR